MLLECVPNFSEGRDAALLAALAEAIQSVAGVRLLHRDVGAGANRTVFTFAGPADATCEAAFRAMRVAAERIDMRRHTGTHPRLGGTDVCPLVPLGDAPLAVAAEYARQLGERAGRELEIPVYLYQAAATRPERRNLANIRRGEYEGLADKLTSPDWQPDYGPAEFQPRLGATIIGARPFLIAWNIDLNTQDTAIARHIAGRLRTSGYLEKSAGGKTVRRPGKFRGLKGIGWYLIEYGRCQVSLNVTDFRQAPLAMVYEAAQRIAEEMGVKVIGSELIGLVPEAAILAAGRHFSSSESSSRKLAASAANGLGLDGYPDFMIEERVVEWALKNSTDKFPPSGGRGETLL